MVIRKIGFAFRVAPGLSIAIAGALITLSGIVLTFLQGFHIIDAPALVGLVLSGGLSVSFLGIGIWLIRK